MGDKNKGNSEMRSAFKGAFLNNNDQKQELNNLKIDALQNPVQLENGTQRVIQIDMGHTVPHAWARDELNKINAPVNDMKDFARQLGNHGQAQLHHWNNQIGRNVHNNVMREVNKGVNGNPGNWNLNAQNHYVKMHNDLTSIKNQTTNPNHHQAINNMLGSLNTVMPKFQHEVKHNPGFAHADKIGNFSNPNSSIISHPHVPSTLSAPKSGFAPVATGTLLGVSGAFFYTAQAISMTRYVPNIGIFAVAKGALIAGCVIADVIANKDLIVAGYDWASKQVKDLYTSAKGFFTSQGDSANGTSFYNNVLFNGLYASYSGTNDTSKFNIERYLQGKIDSCLFQRGTGGIETSKGVIEGLLNEQFQLEENFNIVIIPGLDNNDGNPFTDQQLHQITEELYQGIFNENTFPFFSLHFNTDGTMYPVIHPVYQNTIVGSVIGFLDYYMQGYLNGGFFHEKDVKEWNKTQNYQALNAQLVQLQEYVNENKLGFKYVSFNQMMNLQNIRTSVLVQSNDANDPNKKMEIKTKYSISFRIIAKQQKFEKIQQAFIMHPDFDVFYTIDIIDGSIKEKVEKQNAKGDEGGQGNDNQADKDEDSQISQYIRLQRLCIQTAKDIKENFVKLPLVQQYFQMLHVIQFYCYYFHTLKTLNKRPQFFQKSSSSNFAFGSPPRYPPLPVTQIHTIFIKMDFHQIFEIFSDKEKQQTLMKIILQLENTPEELLSYYLIKHPEVIKRIVDRLMILAAYENREFEDDAEIFSWRILLIMQNTRARCIADRQQFKNQKIELENQKNQHLKQIATKQQENVKQNLKSLTQQHQEAINSLEQNLKQNLNSLDVQQQQVYNQSQSSLDNQLNESINKLNQDVNQAIAKNPFQAADIRTQRDQIINDNRAAIEKQQEQILRELNTKVDEQKSLCSQNFDTNRNQINNKIKVIKDEEIKRVNEFYRKEENQLNNRFQQGLKELNNMERENEEFIQNVFTINIISEKIQFDYPKRSITLQTVSNKSQYNESQTTGIQIHGGCGITNTNRAIVQTHQGQTMFQSYEKKFNSSQLDPLKFYVSKENKWCLFRINFEPFGYSFPLLQYRCASTGQDDPNDYRMMYLRELIDSFEIESIKENQSYFRIIIKENYFHIFDFTQRTAIHYAVLSQNTYAVQVLLDLGANGNNEDHLGLNCMHLASTLQNSEIIELLHKRYPKLILKLTINEISPLYFATEHGKKQNLQKIINILKSFGGDVLNTHVNGEIHNGLFPLYIATMNNDVSSVETLVATGILDSNKIVNDHSTALHLAAQKDFQNILSILYEQAKGSLDKERKNGFTPVHDCAYFGSLNCLKYIVTQNRKYLDLQNSNGETPLEVAIKANKTNICYYLLNEGASVQQQLQSQLSLLDYCLDNCNQNLTDLLKKNLKSLLDDSNQKRLIEKSISNRFTLFQGSKESSYRIEGPAIKYQLIHVAVAQGDMKKVKALLEDNNFQDREQNIYSRESLLYVGLVNQSNDLTPLLLPKNLDYLKYWTSEIDGTKQNHLELMIEADNAFCLRMFYYENLPQLLRLEDANKIQYLKDLAKIKITCDDFRKIDQWDCGILFKLCRYASVEIIVETIEYMKYYQMLKLQDSFSEIEFLQSLIIDDYSQRSILYAAILSQNIQIVDFLLVQFGIQLNNIDIIDQKCLMNPITLACMNSDVNMVEFLIERGANYTQKDKLNKYPLDYVIEADAGEVMRFLLNPQLDLEKNRKEIEVRSTQSHSTNIMKQLKIPNFKRSQDYVEEFSGIHQLILQRKFEEFTQLLNDQKIDLYKSIFGISIAQLSILIASEIPLIYQTLFSNQRYKVNNLDFYQKPAIYYAVKFGQIEVVKYLIENHGVNVNDTYGPNKKSLLCEAAKQNFIEIAKILIKYGAKITPTSQNLVPLHYAAQHKTSLPFIELLLNLDPQQLNHVSDYGTTPFHIACSVDQIDVDTIEFLIQNGANINFPVTSQQQDKGNFQETSSETFKRSQYKQTQGATPYLLSISKNNLPLCSLLERAGANIAAKDSQNLGILPYAILSLSQPMLLNALSQYQQMGVQDPGQSDIAFCLACTLGNSDALTTIMHICDISPETTEYNGDSAMHLAARSNNDKTIQILYYCGFPLETQNHHGETPLQVAIKQGNMTSINTLIELGADLKVVDISGNTIAHLCVIHNAPFALALLIQNYSFNIEIHNHEKLSCIDLAIKLNNEKCFYYCWLAGFQPNLQILNEQQKNQLKSFDKSKFQVEDLKNLLFVFQMYHDENKHPMEVLLQLCEKWQFIKENYLTWGLQLFLQFTDQKTVQKFMATIKQKRILNKIQNYL